MAQPNLKKRDTEAGENLDFLTGTNGKLSHCSLKLFKSKEHSSVSTDGIKLKNLC